MRSFVKFVNLFGQRDQGVTAIEYGLIASLIAVAIIRGDCAGYGCRHDLHQHRRPPLIADS